MISAVIVNYRCHESTLRAVASVLADMAEAEVIVVDNSESAAEIAALERALPSGVKLIVSPHNIGFGRACNLALQQARSPWIFLLNPDAFVVPGCLPRLLIFLQNTPSAAAVAPVGCWDSACRWRLPPGQMPSPLAELILSLALRWPSLGKYVGHRFRRWALSCLNGKTAIRQKMLSGGHVLLRRHALEAAGGLFDPAFFMYYEDADLCRRLRRAGFELYLLPTAAAVHAWRCEPAKGALSRLSRRYYFYKHFARSPWPGLRRRLERRRPAWRLPDCESLGEVADPVEFTVPREWRAGWVLEISPHPLFVPAAYRSGEGSTCRIPPEVWTLLGKGDYWARLQPKDRPLLSPESSKRFHWRIPGDCRPEPLQNDVLDLLVQTAQPLSTGQAAAGLSLPETAGPLADRFGLKHDPQKDLWLKIRQPKWQLRWARKDMQPGWMALFDIVFGYRMPVEFWAWKYADADPIGTAVFLNDRMVAFYGGIPRPVHYLGQPVKAVQIGDVMVHPSERGALTKKSPFQMAAATYLELCIGYGRPYLLGFGFPEEKAMHLGQRLGLYEAVDRMVEIAWPAARGLPDWRVYARPVSDDAADEVDRLWAVMAAAMQNSIVGVRDWTFISYRYLRHPTVRYTVLLVRNRHDRAALGLVVLRDRQEQGVELIDLLGPPERFESLLSVARRFAGISGRERLFGWITASHAHYLTGSDSQITPLNVRVPANVWSPGPTTDEVRDRWWLMGGDTDFR
ncbi:GNAT family N-acetyltransferase [Methylocaldum sp. MU1018]